jgi:hypothetical protein
VLTVWHIMLLVAGFLFIEFLFNSNAADERDGHRR